MSARPDSAIRWFKDISLADRPTVGGKGASLGEMTQAGIRVPPGFVVTTEAFERFIEAVDPDGAIRRSVESVDTNDLTALKDAAERARQTVEGTALPDALYAELETAYKDLCGDAEDAPVAVRSSATSEDSAEASFAGLQDTYLWVRGLENVVHYVRACWSSLYTQESVSYRRRLGLPEEGLAMAVVVQAMVNARASGVMFTRSPTTGDPSIIMIEGSWGLGSSIVSGEVTPDKFAVNKVTGEISHRAVARKTIAHLPEKESGGIREERVAEDKQSVACISDDELRSLAEIAKRVEAHYDSPQDIEWAIPREDALGEGPYLLQSRPETVWATRGGEPVAKPKEKAVDHIFSIFGGGGR